MRWRCVKKTNVANCCFELENVNGNAGQWGEWQMFHLLACPPILFESGKVAQSWSFGDGWRLLFLDPTGCSSGTPNPSMYCPVLQRGESCRCRLCHTISRDAHRRVFHHGTLKCRFLGMCEGTVTDRIRRVQYGNKGVLKTYRNI